MDWQLAAAAVVVLVAAAYLVRRAARSWSRSRTGCGSCGSAQAPAPRPGIAGSFIPSDQLILKNRNPKHCDE